MYAMPIASNSRLFLAGTDTEPIFNHLTVDEISALARNRWLVPRSKRKPCYLQFRREQLRDVLRPETRDCP